MSLYFASKYRFKLEFDLQKGKVAKHEKSSITSGYMIVDFDKLVQKVCNKSCNRTKIKEKSNRLQQTHKKQVLGESLD